MNQTKTCTNCGKTLPIDNFYTNHYSSDGHTSWCKQCVREDNHKRKLAKKALAEKAEETVENTSSTSKNTDWKTTASTKELTETLRGRGITVLVNPEPKDLISALAKLGYTGTLEYYVKQSINISNFK